jgi:SAM-dependent methyltransferase
MNPTGRFSNRVDDYVRYRPGYPAAVLDVLRTEAGLTPSAVVADVGSGTGISTALFLGYGNTVYAVEPNAGMRAAAERQLGTDPKFRSVIGTAEATTLPAQSVDFVVSGQAFHWFDRVKARAEFVRVLRPGGWCVLMWYTRKTGIPFLDAFEALLKQYGTDYGAVRHDTITPADVAAFFGGLVAHRRLGHEQRFDLAGFLGRLRSSSYIPAEGHPQFAPMTAAAERLFAAHSVGGEVRFEYDTDVYFGHVT